MTDTVTVYHFIISKSKKAPADTGKINTFSRASKAAYGWISAEAGKYGQRLILKEKWPDNRDTLLKKTFVYSLPSYDLSVLIRKRKFRMLTRKKTKTEPEKIEMVDWKKAMIDSIKRQLKDSLLANQLPALNGLNQESNTLLAFHFLKARKSSILGFYSPNRGIFIGDNSSCTIAHETLHFLGAPDLYIHRYWPGKRRRLVKKKLWSEIMDWGIEKRGEVKFYYVSEYTAYTMAWKKDMNKKFKPLLKQRKMAKVVFMLKLILGF